MRELSFEGSLLTQSLTDERTNGLRSHSEERESRSSSLASFPSSSSPNTSTHRKKILLGRQGLLGPPFPQELSRTVLRRSLGGKAETIVGTFLLYPDKRMKSEPLVDGRASLQAGLAPMCVCDHQGNRNEEDRERLRERAKRERRVS